MTENAYGIRACGLFCTFCAVIAELKGWPRSLTYTR